MRRGKVYLRRKSLIRSFICCGVMIGFVAWGVWVWCLLGTIV